MPFLLDILKLKFLMHQEQLCRKLKTCILFGCFTPITMGENGHLPLSSKIFNKMPHIWNYFGKCLYFETRFLDNRVKKKLELEFHVKYLSSWNSGFLKKFKWNSSSINSSTLHGTQVPKKKKNFSKSMFTITRCSKNRVLYLEFNF